MSEKLFVSLVVIGLSHWACATGGNLRKTREEARPDAVELFRRARFSELARVDSAEVALLAEKIRPKHLAEGEDVAEWNARVAYRKGDAQAARAALNGLPANSDTRKILGALLENADLSRPLRGSDAPAASVDLPLHRYALALGYPVVEVTIRGRRFRMLWDTGATENVLTPAAVAELDLVRTGVQYPVQRKSAGYVVRFAATQTAEMSLGEWSVQNVPWLVAEASGVGRLFVEDGETLDGFLSPQLLLPSGCFAVDRERAQLSVGFTQASCKHLVARAERKAPVFAWNGEVYASARVEGSPELAVQLETGSPVTFLRADATRWLPTGAVRQTIEEASGEIAHDLATPARFAVAGRARALGAIDMGPRSRDDGHDDIATLGTDVLLEGRGFVVSFATMELGLIDGSAHAGALASAPKN